MIRPRPYAAASFRAFTLIELLAVITIIGIIAAVVGPTLTHFRKDDAMTAATRQMLDDVGRARQLAISQRTTVYMVFVGDNFWNNLAPANRNLPIVTNLLDKQFTGYTFVSLRTVGDQPGHNNPHYLSTWRVLPESIYIVTNKFDLPTSPPLVFTDVSTGNFLFSARPFERYSLPFPTETFPAAVFPCIAFNYLGQLISGRDEYIPLAHGSVLYSKNPNTKAFSMESPSVEERPPGNSTNSYNVIHIDWLTGRGRLERREIL